MGGPNFNATVTGNGNPGVQGISANGNGVVGRSGAAIPTVAGAGVLGTSPNGPGVDGRSTSSFGVQGTSSTGTAVRARSIGSGNGVFGTSGGGGIGIDGLAVGSGSVGVRGQGEGIGVVASSVRGTALIASSGFSNGIQASSDTRLAVWGIAGTLISPTKNGVGVYGTSTVSGGAGVKGDFRGSGSGVEGASGSGSGVEGTSGTGDGVRGTSSIGSGVHGICLNPDFSLNRVGGLFEGGIKILNGIKPFTIDHPLDPQNKYLVHTSVESSEMKNIYDGIARLDNDGVVWVELPEWFEALNGDFRYQLTAIGGSAPNLHVAEEISENRFKIAGGEAGMKVCWQVTGSRRDPWAAANPFQVEQEKREQERGRYLDPSLYDAPEEQRVMIVAAEEEQRAPEPLGIDLARLEEERQLRTNDLGLAVEELRRETEELRQMERHDEAPPEST
jgi:hypothetical protein